MDSLNEVYEGQWPGHDLLFVQAQNVEMLWQDFSHKLGDQVLIPLNTYQSQFPEMRVSFHVTVLSLSQSCYTSVRMFRCCVAEKDRQARQEVGRL
jgi:hypothetical protein